MKSEGFKESEGFPKRIRIKRDKEFEEVVKKGEKKVGFRVVIYRLRENGSSLKFGIRVGKNIRKAVKRNRIKRILREILRKNKEKFSSQEKILIIYKSSDEDVTTEELQKEIFDLLR